MGAGWWMCVSDSGRPGLESMDMTHDLAEVWELGLITLPLRLPWGLRDLMRSKRSVWFSSLRRVRLFVTLWTVAPLPGKNTGVGCRFLLQGIFPTQGSNLPLLRWQEDSLPGSHQGSPSVQLDVLICMKRNRWWWLQKREPWFIYTGGNVQERPQNWLHWI